MNILIDPSILESLYFPLNRNIWLHTQNKAKLFLKTHKNSKLPKKSLEDWQILKEFYKGRRQTLCLKAWLSIRTIRKRSVEMGNKSEKWNKKKEFDKQNSSVRLTNTWFFCKKWTTCFSQVFGKIRWQTTSFTFGSP